MQTGGVKQQNKEKDCKKVLVILGVDGMHDWPELGTETTGWPSSQTTVRSLLWSCCRRCGFSRWS